MRKLEERFAEELVVVGVHSGKFHAERQTANIRQAVLRLDIRHPVVNDRFFRLWRAYGVNAWPTLALIDTEGQYVGAQAGETAAEQFTPVIQRMVDRARRLGRLNRGPFQLRPESEAEPARPLAFPGKIHAGTNRRLFVSDTNHHRIIVLRLAADGGAARVERIIGGRAGWGDGSFDECAFDHPQGLALVGDVLFIADAGNHAVRAANLNEGRVETVAGTGRQSLVLGLVGSSRRQALNSPWDVVAHEGVLYVAMAGAHQIWALDLRTGEIGPHAGSGYEALADGELPRAALAQPSGITTDGRRLLFADSEASAIRWADTRSGGRVGTIVGTGLFDFGDRDGMGDEARLQHASGVAWNGGLVYIADTYNNKIKVVDPGTRAVRTLLGTGDPGTFYEPEGLAVVDGRVYVADTNHHRIRFAEVSGGPLHTLDIEGL